eukprot:CAMPEP_0201718128 /NCGR_PEP_ID=MMETSP0593-20130828/3698_1 /ASSEMBLY_ACC=CAM_ASM_000672 /TAXON_ID=267983 /ORGANISM="Skeletonema japonicum, Strain CCMP2506" /LENGTH=516 /DNA_ID=CAMNT_0048208345 /DNA_START=40 /DNA_END=1590 /DNA_ORIENTATION=+
MSSSFKRRGKRSTAPSSLPSISSETSTAGEKSSFTSILSEQSKQVTPISKSKLSPQKIISTSLPGTKSWTNNLTLTSFGLREIDSFLFSSGGEGGGQPLQTLVMLEEDRLTDDLARALCRYWCAEGVAQGQKVALAAFQPSIESSLQSFAALTPNVKTNATDGSTPEQLHDFILSLPRNLHLDKQRKSSQSKKTGTNLESNRESISAIIEEEEDDDEESEDKVDDSQNKNEEGLVNAWQYRKTIQDKRSGVGNRSANNMLSGSGVYCHSYDLSKRMMDQFRDYSNDQNPLLTNTNIVDCSHPLIGNTTQQWNDTNECQKRGISFFRCVWKHIQTLLGNNPNTVIRLFLQRLPIGIGSVAMPLLMAKIRKLNLPVVVLATIRPWKWIASPYNTCNQIDMLASLRNATDVTLSLDSFASLRAPPPAEFSLLQGILTVRKCAAFTVTHYTDTITWKRPLAERFGVKRDGRKLTVQLLHLPPEEFSKGGSSTSGVRSGGGNVSNDKKKNTPACGSGSLDF